MYPIVNADARCSSFTIQDVPSSSYGVGFQYIVATVLSTDLLHHHM